ncbi:hypothetical protein O181_054648 [Austropuccinia psidii MF-1]|uniref:Uncharacterized protein n=1 Tax=Austropuccinia psidii MF-1 TaxID=1389203 RepID=A0A9Q3E9P6_9BASI|nr:hypothetical protein [Austropuccinia psidii MF-1]
MLKWFIPEVKATIKSNNMDLDKEEARRGPDLASLPQEIQVWRIPELPPIPQASIEIYQSQYKNWYRAAKEEEWEICPSLWQGAMKSYLHIKSFLGQERTIEHLGEWNPFSCKNKVKKIKNWLKNQSLFRPEDGLVNYPSFGERRPVSSNNSKKATEMSKKKPKGPEKKQKGLKNHQGKGKGKENWDRPHSQGYRIPKLEFSAVDSVFNMARMLLEFTAKEDERIKRTLSHK